MNPALIPRLQARYSLRDFLQGAGALLCGSRPDQLFLPGTDLELLPVSSGRAGLYLILEALGLRAGSGVAVPLYCCPTVFEAIIRAGYDPVFVDIGEQGYSLSPEALRGALRGNTGISAVVVVHMFGVPADVNEITEAAAGVPVIEDCAHAVGARRNGRPVGVSGVASFFSFGRGKWPAVGGGGIYAADEALRDRLRAAIDALPEPGSISQTLRGLRTLAMSAAYRPPWYGLFSLAAADWMDRRLDLRGLRDFRIGRMDRTDRRVLSSRLREFPVHLAEQRGNASQLVEALKGQPVELLVGNSPGEPNWYLFPLRFSSREQRDEARQLLSRQQVDSMAYLSDIAATARERYGYTGNCPNTERAADCTLVVPHYHSLRPSQLRRVADSLCEFLAATSEALL